MPWCAGCAAQVRHLPIGCPRCACPPSAPHGCWPTVAPVDLTVAAFEYRGPVAAAVVRAKVGGARGGWAPLAAPLAARLRGTVVDAVTWVTTAPATVRRRGVDHARSLAAVVAAAVDAPLMRLLDVGRGRAGRDGAGPGPHRAVGRLPGGDLILVDDVLTTGGTAWGAAAALRAAGAGSVILAVVARAGTHPLGPSRRPPAGPRRRA